MLALVDAKYKFIYVDVGCNGRISDGGVYRNSSLRAALENIKLGIPPPRYVRGSALPYVIVADDAFPLKTYLMKPYPFRGVPFEKRVTNYRISRARRVSENAFGILGNRFGIFLSAIQLSPEKKLHSLVAYYIIFSAKNHLPATHRPAVLIQKT